MALEVRSAIAEAIVIVVIGTSLAVPLLPRFRFTYKTLLRALIAIGFSWIVLMVICRCLFPRIYAPASRAYEWNYGSVLAQVSLRLFYFFSLMAAAIGAILLWVEFRFYRLSPNFSGRRHLLEDAILLVAYLGSYVALLQFW